MIVFPLNLSQDEKEPGGSKDIVFLGCGAYNFFFYILQYLLYSKIVYISTICINHMKRE
jgi:hypothetical protein